MKVNDIDKTGASSLKKGITTGRTVNPLMPQYNYPAWRKTWKELFWWELNKFYWFGKKEIFQ